MFLILYILFIIKVFASCFRYTYVVCIIYVAFIFTYMYMIFVVFVYYSVHILDTIYIYYQ